jgi:hypothetical protein
VTAGEDHAEQLVVGAFGAFGALGAIGVRGRGEQRELVLAGAGAAQPVDGLATGGSGQPAARIRRDLAVPPVLEGLDEGILDGVGGEADVTDPGGQRGGNPGCFGPVELVQACRVQGRSAWFSEPG